MLTIVKNAIDREVKTISTSDHQEHGSILCSSWPAAQLALNAAAAIVPRFWTKFAVSLALFLLNMLVKKFCPQEAPETDKDGGI